MLWGPINLAGAPVDGFGDALATAVEGYQQDALQVLDDIRANAIAAVEANAQAHVDAAPLIEDPAEKDAEAQAAREAADAEAVAARQAEADAYLADAKAAIETGHQERCAALEEADEQMNVALKAVADVVVAGAVGAGTVNVIISGGATPDHKPVPGENSRISIIIACADQPDLSG